MVDMPSEAVEQRRDVSAGSGHRLRRERTRERVLFAASDLFTTKGYEQTTMDDIAREAQVARQTVFNHFPRKEDFAFAWGRRNRDALDRLLIAPEFAKQSVTTQLVMIMRHMSDIYDDAPGKGQVFLTAWVKAGGPIVESPLMGEQFASVIERGQQSGELRADVDPYIAGELVRALFFDALFRWASERNGGGAVASLFEGMLGRLEIVLVGLCVVPDRKAVQRSVKLVQSVEHTKNAISAADEAAAADGT